MRSLSHKLGALRERDFRLLFTATTITTLGDRLASIALVFAVLAIGSATDLGLVLGARALAEAAIMLFGGVLADRLPRTHVLVGASLVQGVAQTATAIAILGGTDSIALIVALQVAYGLGAGVVIPTEVGLVPQTVSAARLQQANALQGLTRSGVAVLGPALGGALIVAGSPGIALAVDAASFFVCAAILGRIRIARREGATASFLADLREGWTEFSSRTWLWASVVLFGIGNLAFSSWIVLGPVIAERGSRRRRRLGDGAHRRRHRLSGRRVARDPRFVRRGRSSSAPSPRCRSPVSSSRSPSERRSGCSPRPRSSPPPGSASI